jgi:hypothetical protein
VGGGELLGLLGEELWGFGAMELRANGPWSTWGYLLWSCRDYGGSVLLDLENHGAVGSVG